jgi:hypothetical protein
MLKSLLFSLLLALNISSAFSHDLDLLLQNDREERIQRINEMSLHLNQSLIELNKVQADLDQAVANEKKTKGLKVVIRNASAAAAAVGIVATILYQSKGINPSKIILAGGYGLSGLAGSFAYMENKSIRFTHEEILKLQSSINDLQEKIEVEKRNLAREIRLLCLSQGGSPAECDQVN